MRKLCLPGIMALNTSFNVRSEPIVCTPEDGLRFFMGTVSNSCAFPARMTKALRVASITRACSSLIEEST